MTVMIIFMLVLYHIVLTIEGFVVGFLFQKGLGCPGAVSVVLKRKRPAGVGRCFLVQKKNAPCFEKQEGLVF